MFLLSKIVQIVTSPGVLVLLLLVLGAVLLWTRWRRAGLWITTLTVAFLVTVSVLPIGSLMLAKLENRFPVVHDLPPAITGIITLGGAVNQIVTRERGQVALSGGAERMTESVALARRYPSARLVFTGGSASLLYPEIKEAEVARMFFREMGVDARRITFESESRNTYENAVFTYRLMAPAPGETWVLVTSAMHMPRAMGVFRKAGWSPIAYPVDFNTHLPVTFHPGLNLMGGLGTLSYALHEWIGLAAYRMLGRTDALFPGPGAVPAR